MPTLTPPPRVQIFAFRALLTAVSLATALAGGCEMARHESMSLGDTSLMASGGYAATTSEAVFEVPEANALAVAYGRENLPEYSRLDGSMNIYTPTIRTATNQWPQEPAPQLAYPRYVYIPVNTNSSSIIIPVFPTTQPYWRGHGY